MKELMTHDNQNRDHDPRHLSVGEHGSSASRGRRAQRARDAATGGSPMKQFPHLSLALGLGLALLTAPAMASDAKMLAQPQQYEVMRITKDGTNGWSAALTKAAQIGAIFYPDQPMEVERSGKGVRNRFDVAEAISWAWIAITVPDTFSAPLFRSAWPKPLSGTMRHRTSSCSSLRLLVKKVRLTYGSRSLTDQ
jgi:hypothetical protein